MIDKALLEILACPLGKSELRLEGDKLVCVKCNTKFRIEDGIPVMLIEEMELPEGITSIDQLPCRQEQKGDAENKARNR